MKNLLLLGVFFTLCVFSFAGSILVQDVGQNAEYVPIGPTMIVAYN